jgi:uncharacterized membrane protein AbrB (regulator of aidB expression)
MYAQRPAEDPRRRQLRYLAWSIALVLAVAAWFQESGTAAGWLRLAAAVIFAVGTVLPGVLRQPFLVFRSALRRIIGTMMPKQPTDTPPSETTISTHTSSPR